jgi:hypothetical protein
LNSVCCSKSDLLDVILNRLAMLPEAAMLLAAEHGLPVRTTLLELMLSQTMGNRTSVA